MEPLALHDFHHGLGARFGELAGCETVTDYGEPAAEHDALLQSAGVIDLSYRGRVCLTGEDRSRFLHGQVTHGVKDLAPGQGCYAALVTAKGRLQSDLNIHCLQNELLLDFEPGLSQTVTQRLENYIIADDVQLMDVSPLYGLLSVQGPESAGVVTQLGLWPRIPGEPHASEHATDPDLGDVYLMRQPRLRSEGYDLFVPRTALETVGRRLIEAATSVRGRACGWQALEVARIEAGIPRFGADMDESNLAPEAIPHAISYTKGCYIGQEVIARIRTYGQVTKSLRALLLDGNLAPLPRRGDKLIFSGQEAGYITSAVASPRYGKNIALGYVRKEANKTGAELTLKSASGESTVVITELPPADA